MKTYITKLRVFAARASLVKSFANSTHCTLWASVLGLAVCPAETDDAFDYASGSLVAVGPFFFSAAASRFAKYHSMAIGTSDTTMIPMMTQWK